MKTSLKDRRAALAWLGAGTSATALAACGSSKEVRARDYRISYSEAEWRRRLSREEYRVLREAGTERPFSSPLDNESRRGTFVCAGCGNRLYSSAHKFDSGTGWPSFWQPVDSGAVGYSTDYNLGYARREVHCADCGGHLGHVFNDGPRPTGERHCINGVAMDFRPG
ncbi:peptide-methionine (R)-S-oxide reductase MsrB [Aurantiacibacter gangjinensis]|uniref:peptide-methionine (R)-S-oxide reductase n=1 Tax=Aurantiacibacter gangjinensis TaxID=502682 RepID=A0A0G9MQ76_9SPHN|nr:peptide-methionine (R)-S-oxide reductase MsrB [Aurantiacibacter gangjinensis]APE27374.1 Peptide methionine sulfoxide reductase MsrB [Aurantiacibacter gangjinensis]KLE31458.1 methionine sulfoxide reductase B [Aurantiacibacter gangjinensis]